MKTAKEIRDAKSRIIHQGKLVAELELHEGYKLLESKLDILCEDAKESVLASESFEDFRYRRGYLDGINALMQEVDTIISKGKKQEQLIKK
jgi:hypothetical protein